MNRRRPDHRNRAPGRGGGDRSAILLAGVLISFASAAGPTTTPRPRVEGDPGGAPPLRLVEQLTRCEIRSPLPAVATAAEAVAGTGVVDEGFETADLAALGWPEDGTVQLGPRPGKGGGRALRFRGGSAHKIALVQAVASRTWYRVRRSIRTRDHEVSLRVVETTDRLEHPEQRNHPADLTRVLWGKFTHPKRLVRVHRFAPPHAGGEWETGSLLLHTASRTRTLVLILEDAVGSVTGSARDVWLDDWQVERLDPSPEQALALLAALAPLPGVDGGPPGLVQDGPLLPRGNPRTAAPPADANFTDRIALLAPAPTTIGCPISVPPAGRLHLSYGLHRAARPGDAADLVVRVRPPDGPADEVFRQRLTTGTKRAGWHWRETAIDLAAYAGQEITLELAAAAVRGTHPPVVWGDPVVSAPRRPADPPNVILVGIDTIRADRLSSYGHHRPTTPHLDALARAGVRFDQPISVSNWTSPAFASLFTGQLPPEHRLLHRARALPAGIPTVAGRLRAAGYHTHAIAYKAYMDNMGFHQGFSTYFDVPDLDRTADDLLARTREWLDRHGDRRFFLFLHSNDPHQPFNQPPPFDRTFNTLDDLARFGAVLPLIVTPRGGVLGCERCRRGRKIDPGFMPLAHALYDAELKLIDDRLGQLFAALKQRGLYEQTVIAVVGDHGEVMWDRGLEYFGHAGPYVSDEAVRVPLIVKPAGEGWARGAEITTQVRIHDLAPTLLDLAGVDGPRLGTDARSLLPLLRPASGPPPADRLAVSENLKQRVLAVRRDGWKYVLRYRQDRALEEKLFHVARDPGELRQVARRHPEVLAGLRRAAARHLLAQRSGPLLLIRDADAAPLVEVGLSSDRPLVMAERLLGLSRVRRDGPRAVRFTGPAAEPPALLVQLGPADGDARLRVRLRSGPAAGGPSAAREVTPARRTVAQCLAALSGSGDVPPVLLCR